MLWHQRATPSADKGASSGELGAANKDADLGRRSVGSVLEAPSQYLAKRRGRRFTPNGKRKVSQEKVEGASPRRWAAES
jgi:hypothetical protein